MSKKRLPKEVQSMVDGGFNLLNIIIAIIVAVRELAVKLGQTEQQWKDAIHRLSRPEGADTVRAIAELIIGKTAAVVQRTWQGLLNACHQYWVNYDFTEARWPLEPVAVDESAWEVKECLFNDDATGEEKLRRLAEMVNKGEIRLCGIRRAMEYVATHLDVQLNYSLVVPVSAPDSGGILCLPAFDHAWGGGRERKLDLYRVSNDFVRQCGWLVLRKCP